MAVIGTSTDYTGRKKDISIFQSPDALKLGAQDVSPKFGKTTKACAGVQKLIQRYAIMLLSSVNSQPNFKDFGTAFMPTLTAGISPTDKLAAAQIFASANYTTVLALKAYQKKNQEIPLDERIAKAVLDSITLSGSYASFNIKIYTEAGDNVTFLIPIPK